MSWLDLAAAWPVLVVTGAGWVVARAGLAASSFARGQAGLLAAGLAPVIGHGLAYLLLFSAGMLRAPRPGPVLFLIVAGSVALGLHRSMRAARAAAPVPRLPFPRPSKVALLLAVLATVMAIVGFVRLSASWPLGSWDAVSHWSARARLMDRDYPAALERFDRIDTPASRYYPILLPGSVALQLGWTSGDDEAVTSVTATSFLVGLGALLGAIVRLNSGPTVAALALAFFAATPAVTRWGAGRTADIPMAAALLATSVGIMLLLDRHAISPALVGLLVPLLASVKREGVPAGLILCLAAAWIAYRDRILPHARTWITIALGAAPALAALLVFRLVQGEGKGFGSSFIANSGALADFQSWKNVALAVLRELNPLEQTRMWGLGLCGVAFAAVWIGWQSRSKPSSGERFLRLSTLGLFAFYLAVFVLAPIDQIWIINTALARLLLQLYPLALVTVAMGLAGMSRLEPVKLETGSSTR